jgi:hypothetical protein
MPYTLDIPQSEDDRWRWHRDMLVASRHILDVLATIETDDRRKGYVAALKEADADLMQLIDRIIAGLNRRAEEVHS